MSWTLPVIEGVFNVMETVTFIQFIQEEAIQTCSLGVFMAIRARQYHVAWDGIRMLEDQLIPHLQAVNNGIGWASPATLYAFWDFIQAATQNLNTMKELATTGPK